MLESRVDLPARIHIDCHDYQTLEIHVIFAVSDSVVLSYYLLDDLGLSKSLTRSPVDGNSVSWSPFLPFLLDCSCCCLSNSDSCPQMQVSSSEFERFCQIASGSFPNLEHILEPVLVLAPKLLLLEPLLVWRKPCYSTLTLWLGSAGSEALSDGCAFGWCSVGTGKCTPVLLERVYLHRFLYLCPGSDVFVNLVGEP